MPTPNDTCPLEPLNQFCRAFAPARILGWLAVDSIAPREGMKLASDLVGEWKDVREVCCCSVDAARLIRGWQLLKKVPVRDRL